jgi:protoporphyrinogen oxidase
MGLARTWKAGWSYLYSVFFKRPEKSLEDFYINRFGKVLYSMFFEDYTEKLWGVHPSKIDPSWGAQRVKGVSITAVLKDAVGKAVHLKGKKNGEVETSLIEEFSYPKYGPGQLWEITADEIVKKGGRIELGACVKKIHKAKGRVLTGVTWERDGESFEESGDIFISSMPIKDLVGGMNNVPEKAAAIAAGLPYRDYMTVGVLVPGLKLKNKTKIPTIGNIVPDDWVYVHDRSVKMGRFQIFNNWSPYMVADIEHTVWVGLEYFCNEGDEMWSMSDEDFAKMGVSEMVKIGMIDSEDEVIDSHVERVKKAYPAYFDTYDQIGRLRRYLDKIPNLYCVGRNGQHRYNNFDHSMMTSFEAVKNIRTGSTDRSNIWNVNTEKSYHEKK